MKQTGFDPMKVLITCAILATGAMVYYVAAVRNATNDLPPIGRAVPGARILPEPDFPENTQ